MNVIKKNNDVGKQIPEWYTIWNYLNKKIFFFLATRSTSQKPDYTSQKSNYTSQKSDYTSQKPDYTLQKPDYTF